MKTKDDAQTPPGAGRFHSRQRAGGERGTRARGRGGLPFFYGWVIVGAGFITMAVGVNARTAFSLLFPAMLDEFGWERRGMTAVAFSFGFVVAAALSPFLGRLMDRRGPRVVIETGVGMMAAGLLLAPLVDEPWHLYVTLGVLVGGGGVTLGYTGQALFLPNWFVRRRGLAMSLAFSGVGVGSIVLLPWLQTVIVRSGWRSASAAMGILVLVVLLPLNFLLRGRPQDLGFEPDGDRAPQNGTVLTRKSNVVDPIWAARDWTLRLAVQTTRFWWIAAGYFFGMIAWYSVQVHQTKYLVEVRFTAGAAAWALGFVSLVAIPGQIALGHLSDLPSEDAALVLLFSLVASGQIKLRRIDGWRKIAAVVSSAVRWQHDEPASLSVLAPKRA